MSGTLSDDTKRSNEEFSENISKAMGQLSVTTGDQTSTPLKNLSDMPFDVVGLIIKRSDYREQLILRKTSKSLRALVDKQKPACTRIKVLCKFDCIICYYNNHCVAYVSPTGIHDVFLSGNENYRLDTVTTRANYEEVAFDDLAFTLKNPKLELETFSFDSDEFLLDEEYGFFSHGAEKTWKYYDKFENMESILKSIDHQLSVKACRIDVSRDSSALSILPYLKPGVLEKITIVAKVYSGGWGRDAIKQVALLDQWKQARELEMKCGIHKFPMEHATHFKRFRFHVGAIDFEILGKVVRIRDFIMKHENIEFCSISAFYLDAKFFDSIVGTPVSPGLSLYTIPDSEYYLEFLIRDNLLTIEKKKK